MNLEQGNGKLALKMVKNAGGYLSYEAYDRIMGSAVYFKPLHWIAGWGDSALSKSNSNKMCAFVACKNGWLVQEKEGYRITDKGDAEI